MLKKNIKTLFLLIIIVSFFCINNALTIGRRTTSKEPTISYTFFTLLKKQVDDLERETKNKSKISNEEANAFILIAKQVEEIYKNLFEEATKTGLAKTKLEPISLISYDLKKQILQELEKITILLESGLNKAFSTLSKTNKASATRAQKNNMITAKNKVINTLKQTQNDIDEFKKITTKDAKTNLAEVKKIYNIISEWGNFQSLKLLDSNLLKKFTNDQLKTIFQQKKAAIEQLKNKLASIASTTEKEKNEINLLKLEFEAESNITQQDIESFSKSKTTPEELINNLSKLSIELSALKSKI